MWVGGEMWERRWRRNVVEREGSFGDDDGVVDDAVFF